MPLKVGGFSLRDYPHRTKILHEVPEKARLGAVLTN